MPEKSEPRIDRIRVHAELRARVADAIQQAIAQVASTHHIGDMTAIDAMRAADQVLEKDITTSSVEELSLAAQDAAEAVFAAVGFSDAKLVADLHVITQTNLSHVE